MPDSAVLDVALGLIFVFATFAALTSAVTETIARWLGLRADYLLRGIRALVDGQAVSPRGRGSLQQWWDKRFWRTAAVIAPGNLSAAATASLWGADGQTATAEPAPDAAAPPPPATPTLHADRLLRNAVTATQGSTRAGQVVQELTDLTRSELRAMPSYLSGAAFSQAVVAYLVPDAQGRTTLDELRDAIGKLDDSVLKRSLQTLVVNTEKDVTQFRTLVEQWYDDHMARVSGWYKRHVRWISLAIGAAVVLLFNLDAIALATGLHSDQALRDALVQQAVGSPACKAGSAAKTCLDAVVAQTRLEQGAGLPMGWSPFHWTWWHLLGWPLAALALTPGARFWFDLLGKLGTLRSTGPKPTTSS